MTEDEVREKREATVAAHNIRILRAMTDNQLATFRRYCDEQDRRMGAPIISAMARALGLWPRKPH